MNQARLKQKSWRRLYNVLRSRRRSRMMNILLSGITAKPKRVQSSRKRVVAPMTSSLFIGSHRRRLLLGDSRDAHSGKIQSGTQAMADAYPEALEAARKLMRTGELASHVHQVVAEKFSKHGFSLGHLSGHSIGNHA